MPQMRALKSHSWNAGTVARGQAYEATEQEARLLVALGWATHTLAYERTDMQAESPQVPRGTTRAERRAYRRSDMQARD